MRGASRSAVASESELTLGWAALTEGDGRPTTGANGTWRAPEDSLGGGSSHGYEPCATDSGQMRLSGPQSPGQARTKPRFVRVSRNAASPAVLSGARLDRRLETSEANLEVSRGLVCEGGSSGSHALLLGPIPMSVLRFRSREALGCRARVGRLLDPGG